MLRFMSRTIIEQFDPGPEGTAYYKWVAAKKRVIKEKGRRRRDRLSGNRLKGGEGNDQSRGNNG